MQTPIRIFISSVQNEFATERRILYDYLSKDALLGRYFEPFIFEELPANNTDARTAYLSQAASSDIYLGLFGKKYGYEDNEGISPTEREFDIATERGIYRLAFIKETDDTREEKEARFIGKIEQQVVRRSFTGVEDLRSAVYSSLIRFMEDNEILRRVPFDAAFHHHATLKDIDCNKVRDFVINARAKRGFKLNYSEENIPQILKHLCLISDDGRLTNAAILLFAKDPQKFLLTSEVKCAQFYSTIVEKPIKSYQVYHGSVFEMIDQAVDFVMSRIDARVGTREKNTQVDVTYELPLMAVREAICNAVTHRDYTSTGSVQVMLFRDRLEIWNPGRLPYGMTLAKLREVHDSKPVNPILANPIYLAGYIERLGTGTIDLIKECQSAGLAAPVFEEQEDFRVVLYRNELSGNEIDEKTGDEIDEKTGDEKTDNKTNLMPDNKRVNEVSDKLSGNEIDGKTGNEIDDKIGNETDEKTGNEKRRILQLVKIIGERQLSFAEIQKKLKLKGKDNVRTSYINPAIRYGYVVMLYPDNVRRKGQKYYLTEKGKNLLKFISNMK